MLLVGDETHLCRDSREKLHKCRSEKPRGPSAILGQNHLPLPLHFLTIQLHGDQLLALRSFFFSEYSCQSRKCLNTYPMGTSNEWKFILWKMQGTGKYIQSWTLLIMPSWLQINILTKKPNCTCWSQIKPPRKQNSFFFSLAHMCCKYKCWEVTTKK